jgi:hypothetical protein
MIVGLPRPPLGLHGQEETMAVGEAVLFGTLAGIVVRTVCWILRERSRRKTLVDLERERRTTLVTLAELEPDQAERLQGRIERVRPPPDELQPPSASSG